MKKLPIVTRLPKFEDNSLTYDAMVYVSQKASPEELAEIQEQRGKWRVLNDKMLAKKHPKYTDDNQPGVKSHQERRAKAHLDLINIHFYLRDKVRNGANKEEKELWLPLFQTSQRLVINQRVMTRPADGLPLAQLRGQAIELYVANAMNEYNKDNNFKLGHDFIGNDMGIDLVNKGVKYDVKTSMFRDKLLTPENRLRTIKAHALNDPTKKTDKIIWTANSYKAGLLYIVGEQRWSNVINDIINKEDWENIESDYSTPGFHTSKVKDFNEKSQYDTKFIGNFTDKEKKDIENSWNGIKEKKYTPPKNYIPRKGSSLMALIHEKRKNENIIPDKRVNKESVKEEMVM